VSGLCLNSQSDPGQQTNRGRATGNVDRQLTETLNPAKNVGMTAVCALLCQLPSHLPALTAMDVSHAVAPLLTGCSLTTD
jgi:hypothetical protein